MDGISKETPKFLLTISSLFINIHVIHYYSTPGSDSVTLLWEYDPPNREHLKHSQSDTLVEIFLYGTHVNQIPSNEQIRILFGSFMCTFPSYSFQPNSLLTENDWLISQIMSYHKLTSKMLPFAERTALN